MYQTIVTGIAGENIPANSFVYFDEADGKVYLSMVGNQNKKAWGFVPVAKSADAAVQVFNTGIFPYTTSATMGGLLYLGSAGGTTTSKPAGFQQIVAQVVNTNTIMLRFQERINSTQQYVRITSTATTALTNNVDNVLDAGTLVLSWSPVMPANPSDGDTVRITFASGVTALTISGGSISVLGGLTSAVLGQSVVYKYYATLTNPRWIKQQ